MTSTHCPLDAKGALARTILCLLVATSCLVPTSAAADAGENFQLLYIYSPDCGACMQFDRDIAPIYPKTDEAERLPITKILFTDWQAGREPLTECASAPVVGTPTFIELKNCMELDRMTGYSHAELFWLGLRRMINRIESGG